MLRRGLFALVVKFQMHRECFAGVSLLCVVGVIFFNASKFKRLSQEMNLRRVRCFFCFQV